MPALVNSKLGSFFITMGAEGTIWWPFDSKKSRNCWRIRAAVIFYRLIVAGWVSFAGCYDKRINFCIFINNNICRITIILHYRADFLQNNAILPQPLFRELQNY